jgi:hypothetical protein
MLPSAHNIESEAHQKQSFRSLTNLDLTPNFKDDLNLIPGLPDLRMDDYEFVLLNLD